MLKNEIIENAYLEDMPEGDITTDTIIDMKLKSNCLLVAKETGVLAGIEVFKECMSYIDKKIKVFVVSKDGKKVKRGDIIAEINGPTASILKAERVALNILQRMSGIATVTNNLVSKVKGQKVQILDTRKTTPNFRVLEREAVVIGGGHNHRNDLSSMVMIKDNHINAVGSITMAIQMAKAGTYNKIAVEVETKKQFLEAVSNEPDIIMLDNMSLNLMS
jgi:nicotinate-nucleotide pyrophosphorylase (carboxylating)